MKKILVAVSGGVDSVVSLDFLAKNFPRENLIVAHFEHGIRGQESLRDLEFVRNLAEKYGVKFEFAHGNLGENASEDQARTARYDFLRNLAKKFDAEIFTAHHKNDLAETFVLNLARGGGWRAIAAMDSPDVKRPFLRFSKAEILEKAKAEGLIWREDSSNFEQKYARNRIRQKVNFSEQNLNEIFEIWQKQIEIKREIDESVAKIVAEISKNGKFEREFFRENSDEVCFEIVREILRIQSGEIPLGRQVWDFLAKIRTFRPKTKTQILGGKNVNFSKCDFWFENASEKC